MDYKIARVLYGILFMSFGLILIVISYIDCPCKFQYNFAFGLGFLFGGFVSEISLFLYKTPFNHRITQYRSKVWYGVFFHHWIIGIPLIIIGIYVQLNLDIIIGRLLLGMGIAILIHDTLFHLIRLFPTSLSHSE